MAGAEKHGIEASSTGASTINPHFDEGLVVWKDEYSGLYKPVDYGSQFDDQWRLFLEGKLGFNRHTGVETSDPWIDERIFELTGVRGVVERRAMGGFRYRLLTLRRKLTRENRRMGIGGRLVLEPKFPLDFWRGKYCLDLGCGAGRWTRAMIELGARVKSTDVSESGLKSTRRFNDDVEKLDLFDIPDRRSDLHGAFDFSLCWGVIMCTHDPTRAFECAAMTVKPGGHLYVMIYAPTYHNSPEIVAKRKHYHRNLKTFGERLAYAYEISDRSENAINQLDMLNTFYNWTVTEETIHAWFAARGFAEIVTLNRNELNKCAYHVLGRKRR